MRAPSYAKTTRPVLSRVAARERLFRRLAELLRSYRIVWIAAPAGSGKTTLAADFVARLGAPSIWDQIDPRDADPRTFFFFLRAAAVSAVARPKLELPLLTAEYARDVEGYARRFFEQLGACVAPGTLLVLDDYHELAEESPMQRLMPTALASLPPGMRVLVASRAGPPPPLARLAAHGAIGRLDDGELDLTEAETVALARAARLPLPGPAAAAALRTRTRGWVAGTILAGGTDHPAVPLRDLARESIFEYLAAEVLDRTLVTTRRFLLETSVLPSMTVQSATLLTGDDRAAAILSDLVRRNHFTVRLPGAPPRYEYHPLFREFLLARARSVFPGYGWTVLVQRAVDVLRREGSVEDAAALMIEAGDHQGLASLAVAWGPALAEQGRVATLRSWLDALPAQVRDRSGELSYWWGFVSGDSGAGRRASLERAFALFEANGDFAGMLLAWSSLARSFSSPFDDAADVDGWIRRIERILGGNPTFPSSHIEAEVTAALLGTLFWHRPEHPEAEAWATRAAGLLRATTGVRARVAIAGPLAHYLLWWKGDRFAVAQLAEDASRASAAPGADPLTIQRALTIEAGHRAWIGDGDACRETVERGLRLARATASEGETPVLALQGVYGALADHDVVAAERYHAVCTGALARDGRTAATAHHHAAGVWIALCAGDRALAARRIASMEDCARRSGAGGGIPYGAHTVPHLMIEQGRTDEAVAALERCLAWSRRARAPVVEHHCHLSLAYAHLRACREAVAVEALRAGFALGRERGLVTHPWIGWRRDVMAALSSLALERGVEVEHVRAMIRASRLPPPPAAPDDWPYAIRIRTLGRFDVSRDGAPVSFHRKAQRKPLELLKALVALGGVDVREDALCEALYPDAEGDAARHALETTVYRLRKLLGATIVRRRDGRLSLDADTCWADAFALQHTAATLLRDLGADAAELVRGAERIMRLYRGAFLAADEDDLPWVAAPREKLRAHVGRVVTALAHVHAGPTVDSAAERLERHLDDVDPVERSGRPEDAGQARRVVSLRLA